MQHTDSTAFDEDQTLASYQVRLNVLYRHGDELCYTYYRLQDTFTSESGMQNNQFQAIIRKIRMKIIRT